MNTPCQQCRQSNPPEAAFCLNCAAPLPRAQAGGGWQPNQQNFGGQQYGQANFSSTNEASSRAKWAAALGFLGIVCCGLFTSVPAIFVGWMEMSAIKSGQSSPAGKTMASMGFWCGIFGTVLQIGAILFFLIAMMLEGASSSPYYY